MLDNVKLNPTEREYLSDIIESSLRVANRHQLFVWSQGTLQRLIPHEILVCGVDDGSRLGMEYHHFASTRYLRESHVQALCDPERGLLPLMIEESDRTSHRVVFCPARVGQASNDLRLLIEDNEMKNLAAMLFCGARGKVQAFYAFGRVGRPLEAELSHCLELIVPFLHVTFMRVLSNEGETSSRGAPRPGRLVTRRQQEILLLIKDGKTNSEIASILEVSPWTVKNHIQMIFQRLNSNNRTQAISRAISLGILRAD